MAWRFKTAIVRPLHGGALHSGLSAWAARRQPVARVLMIHGVGPDDEISAAVLSSLIQWISVRFRIVSLGTVVDSVRARRPADREVALTFDDGLRCHLEQAYPVLKRYNVPATMFVCPGLVESGRWLWNHEARARLKRLEAAALAELSLNWGCSGQSVEDVVGWMKSLTLARRTEVEDEIRLATRAFQPTPGERARFDPMSWKDLDCLDSTLVTIGSHTLLHPILPMLDDRTLESELVDSRAWLERRLSRPVDLFCYPNGSADGRVRAAAERAYAAAVTTEYGSVGPNTNLLRLPRIPVADRLALMAWRLHRPLS